jgi:hypothetical protein
MSDVTLQGEQLTPEFEKLSTVLGVVGSPRLVSTGEATNVLPLGVVLVSPTGTPYSASGGGGGGGEVTIGDPTISSNQAAVLAPGSSGSFALAVQGVTGGTPQPVSGTVTANAGTGFPSVTAAGSSGSSLTTIQGSASGVAVPVSAASLPLPSGAATAAKQPALGTAGSSSTDVITVQGIASGTAQPISAASLPLPSGASTAAKQPALGTAGSASVDVLTIQGIASMTKLLVDGSGATQPVSGTVTANAGTGFPSTTSAGSSGTNLITVQGSASGVAIPASLATLPALVASTAAIGQVGGKTSQVSVTPTLTASSAYTAGNCVGGLMTFSSILLAAGSGVLQTLVLQCKSTQTATFKFYLYSANPSSSTFTNKSAPSINSADIAKLIGFWTLSTPDSGQGTHTIYVVDGVGHALNVGATTLYGVLVTTGTPTFASTSDINMVLAVLED